MPDQAFAVHGLSDEFLSNKPKFSEIVNEFLEFIGSAKLVIHNAMFDMKFINAEYKDITPNDGSPWKKDTNPKD